jgi:acyl dehydratase
VDNVSIVFDEAKHARFAQSSRDTNPVHVDPVAARRTQAGTPIVHGVHSLLRLIECIAERGAIGSRVTTIKAQFRKPIRVAERVTVETVKADSTGVRARMMVEDLEVVHASIGFGQTRSIAPLSGDESVPETLVPQSATGLSLEETAGRTGRVAFGSTLAQAEAMFPVAARYLGRQQVAALMCSSCLVGMVVPGLHSLFAGLDVSFPYEVSDLENELRFRVMTVEPRFRLVRIAVRGGGLCGFLETVSRVPPVMQATIKSLKSIVGRDEFQSAKALVVGGSRGLGELTAKLLAAGGAHVTITYAAGRQDAEAVAEEIRAFGARCEVAAYDVRKDATAQLDRIGGDMPTQLYYFATPPIFDRKAVPYDQRHFEEFNAFYIAGLFDLLRACLGRNSAGIKVFCPSSAAIQSRPADMTEYAMSKAAAEILYTDMQEYLPGVRILTRRLPRLPTDQTSTVLQVETADPVETILPILREMQA